MRQKSAAPAPKRGSTASAADRAAAAPKYPIESVVNASRVLESFVGAKELRITDVAEALGVSPSTAHRLLTSMEARHLIEQNAVTRCYEPGPALLEIAAALVPSGTRWSFARPYLAALAERVGETVNLLVRQGSAVSFAESVESTSSVRVGSRLGATMPAHTTSGGKILLAALPDEELLGLYPHEEISHPLAAEPVSRDTLMAAVRAARKRGYATNFSESEAGISGVAVRVTAAHHPDFAVAVSVPSARIAPARVTELVGQLQFTAAALSEAVG